MHSDAILRAAATRASTFTLLLSALLLRKVWLPRAVYAAVPWIYLGVGAGSLLGGIYLPEPAWAYPYLLLFGLICLHAGMAIASLRRRPSQRLLSAAARAGRVADRVQKSSS